MPNKLLELLLKCDRRTATDFVLQRRPDFQIYLSVIIGFGRQDWTYVIETAWISHGLRLIWVLAVMISEEHDYDIIIYRQPISHYVKNASVGNSPKFLFASISSF